MTLMDEHKVFEAVLRTQQEYSVANRIMSIMLRKYFLCKDAAVSKRVVSVQQSHVLALLIIANCASGVTLKIQH